MERLDDATVNPIYELDAAVQAWLQLAPLQEDALLRGVASAFNWWGGPGVIWFAALLWLGGRAAKLRAIATAGLRGAEGIAIASAVSGIAKGLAGRSRPFVAPAEPGHWDFNHGWSDARYFSMPSGHTTATVAFVVGAMLIALRWKPAPRAAFIALAWLGALLVAFARLYSNQHWLSDVLVGSLLGAATSLVLARLHAKHPASRFDRWMLGA